MMFAPVDVTPIPLDSVLLKLIFLNTEERSKRRRGICGGPANGLPRSNHYLRYLHSSVLKVFADPGQQSLRHPLIVQSASLLIKNHCDERKDGLYDSGDDLGRTRVYPQHDMDTGASSRRRT